VRLARAKSVFAPAIAEACSDEVIAAAAGGSLRIVAAPRVAIIRRREHSLPIVRYT
jgi:hypothetical protein